MEVVSVPHPAEPLLIGIGMLLVKGIEILHVPERAPDAAAREDMASVGRVDAEISHHQRPAAEVEGIKECR